MTSNSQSPKMATAAKKPKVYNPDKTDYAVRPKQAHHGTRAEILGIEESLLVPQADPRPATQPRTLKELRKWRPTQMRFGKSWSEEEQVDGWFDLLSLDLLMRVKAFTKKHFEFEDIPNTSSDSLWLGFSKEFITYAGMIARQDKHRGGWDGLLRAKATRVPFTMGVIAKVLEVNVFDKLLFGADQVQEDLLSAQDIATIETEGEYSPTFSPHTAYKLTRSLGYRRTELRSRTVRACLGGDIIPPNYWPAVDALTMQLLALLLPMLNLMDKYFPDSRKHSLRAIHQDLHHIVAEAGYLCIAIRWSKNIFRFVTPLHGQQWELEQDNADNEAYEASKAAATDAAGLDASRGPSLIAKVQIVQWPQLQRWAAVGDLDALNDDEGAGETVSCIMRSRVVYYAGVVGDTADVAERVPGVARYVRTVKTRRLLRRTGVVAMAVLLGVAIMAAVVAVLVLVTPAPTLGERLLRAAQVWGRGLVDYCWNLVLVAYAFVLSELTYLWNVSLGRLIGWVGRDSIAATVAGLEEMFAGANVAVMDPRRIALPYHYFHHRYQW